MTYMPNLDAEVRALSLSMDRPSLTGLAHVLRHPEMWPADFRWDYTDCANCGIGLSRQLWTEAADKPLNAVFSIDEKTTQALFYEVRKRGFAEMSATSAVNVADAIDAYLASA